MEMNLLYMSKAGAVHSDILSERELSILMDENKVNDEWYRNVLNHLIQIAKLLSSKYTRSKVRKSNACGFCIYH